jgi:hypothetical protein
MNHLDFILDTKAITEDGQIEGLAAGDRQTTGWWGCFRSAMSQPRPPLRWREKR